MSYIEINPTYSGLYYLPDELVDSGLPYSMAHSFYLGQTQELIQDTVVCRQLVQDRYQPCVGSGLVLHNAYCPYQGRMLSQWGPFTYQEGMTLSGMVYRHRIDNGSYHYSADLHFTTTPNLLSQVTSRTEYDDFLDRHTAASLTVTSLNWAWDGFTLDPEPERNGQFYIQMWGSNEDETDKKDTLLDIRHISIMEIPEID